MDDDPRLRWLYETACDAGLRRFWFDTWSCRHLDRPADRREADDRALRAAAERLRALLRTTEDDGL